MDKKRKTMLGVLTMLFIGEFIEEDIIELGEEGHEKFQRGIIDGLDRVIKEIEEEGPPDILDMEEDMDRFRDALKEFIHHEMEEE